MICPPIIRSTNTPSRETKAAKDQDSHSSSPTTVISKLNVLAIPFQPKGLTSRIHHSYAMRLSPLKCDLLARALGAINCTRGEPTFGLSAATAQQLKDTFEQLGNDVLTHYTDVKGHPQILSELASKLTQLNKSVTYTPIDLVITHGGSSAIALTFQVISRQAQILLASPTYGAYAAAMTHYAPDHPIQYVESDRGLAQLDQLENILLQKKKFALVLALPGNPVGVPTAAYLQALATIQNQHENFTLVLDLAYFDNLPANQFPKLESLFAHQQTIYIRSASKSVSLPALRGGLVYSKNAEFIQQVTNAAECAHLNSHIFSGMAMLAALSMSPMQQQHMSNYYMKRLDYLHTMMALLNLAPRESVHPFFVYTTAFDRLVNKNIPQLPAALTALKNLGISEPNTTLINTTDLVAFLNAHGIGGVGVDTIQKGKTLAGIRLFGAHQNFSDLKMLVKNLIQIVKTYRHALIT
jgi:aspartate/methionine/tyrosine aminotransferase